jgi:predicted nucleic-acid-binding protein
MMSIFVDTNYFIRLLLDDNKIQSEIVKKLFMQAERRKINLVTSTLVLLEINWVLQSVYNYNKIDIIHFLNSILESVICIESKNSIIDVLKLYKEQKLSMEDCFHIVNAKMLTCEKIATFDKKLTKVFNSVLNET